MDLLLLLHCCFTSTVKIKGHVGTVSRAYGRPQKIVLLRLQFSKASVAQQALLKAPAGEQTVILPHYNVKLFTCSNFVSLRDVISTLNTGFA